MFGRGKKSTGSGKKRAGSAAKTPAGTSSKKRKGSSAKSATAKKTASKRAAAGKFAPKKTGARKTAAGKTAGRKKAGTRTAAKKTAAGKTAGRKKAGTKTAAGKTAARKKTGTKTGARKNAAGKSSAGKATRAAPGKSRTSRPHGAAPSVKPPLKAYSGSLPYLFVSYAHRDMKTVFSIIKKLGDKRYRIWYDEGIEPGNEWPEIVGKAIIKCSQFVVFMSPWANKSRNVRNEVNLAFTEKRDIIVVFLEETNMTDGMKLQIGTVQHMNRFDMSEKEHLAQLTKVLKSSVKG